MGDLIQHLLYSYTVSGLKLGTEVEKELLNELTKISYLNITFALHTWSKLPPPRPPSQFWSYQNYISVFSHCHWWRKLYKMLELNRWRGMWCTCALLDIPGCNCNGTVSVLEHIDQRSVIFGSTFRERFFYIYLLQPVLHQLGIPRDIYRCCTVEAIFTNLILRF
jgi:hypothetical protein